MRYLILIHRYLGTAIGILMVGWCLTGVVMMYVRYPQQSEAERLQRLPPLQWRDCCRVGEDLLGDDTAVEEFQIESLGGRPVLHVQLAGRGPLLIDLIGGQRISGVTAAQAARVAQAGSAQPPRLLGLLNYDEWTVSGEFNPARPLYQFALDDDPGTQLYISARTGRVMQATTGHQRFWSWLGAVPHWLYFAQLRRNAALWTQVVIWTSLTGCFLTLFGIYLGVRQFLARPAGRWSGYRGLLYWHHVPGVIFGLFALTWVASGLVSMNPWGFLDSEGSSPALDTVLGPPMTGAQVKQALRTLSAGGLAPGVVSLASAPLRGRPYLVATTHDGARRRVGIDWAPSPLEEADWRRIATDLGATGTAGAQLLLTGDAYYYSRPGAAKPFPARRIVANDGHGTRYYLDPITGAPRAVIDTDGRWYRWLHVGLHTWDFSAVVRSRPLWDLLMLTLLAGVTALCATGTWLGWRRYLRIRPR